MTELKQYENGYSPSALQRKYGLSYEQGYELAQDFKRLQEQLNEANEMLNGAKHLTVKDSNGAVMFELASPEINDYLEKWGVK